MKKTISLILCAVLVCLSLTSCSSRNKMTEENVEWTVDAAITALQNFDTENLGKYVKSTTLVIIIGYAQKHQQFAELGKAIFENLEYEITNIDLEAGTVTLQVKNKDLFEAANDFAADLKGEYTTMQLLQNLNDKEFLDTNLTKLTAKIALAHMSEQPTEITLNITEGEHNLILSFDGDAEDAVSGGALNAVKSVFTAG